MALYARVSCADPKEDAVRVRQMQRLRDDAAACGYPVVAEVIELASGLNDERPKRKKMLTNSTAGVIVVEQWSIGTGSRALALATLPRCSRCSRTKADGERRSLPVIPALGWWMMSWPSSRAWPPASMAVVTANAGRNACGTVLSMSCKAQARMPDARHARLSD